jgi:hypothetical protein
MASYECFGAIALTGGADGALDAVDGANLADGDVGIAVDAINNRGYFYTVNSTKGGSESSPGYIQPDTNAASIMWQLCDVYGMDGSDTVHYLSNKPNRVAASSITANDLVGMDASGDLIKTSVTFASVPEIDEAQAWTAAQQYTVTSVAVSTSAISLDYATNMNAKTTLNAATVTVNAPTNLVDGRVIIWRAIQDGTGGRTISFNAAYDFADHDATYNTAASADTYFMFWTNGTKTYARQMWKDNA